MQVSVHLSIRRRREVSSNSSISRLFPGFQQRSVDVGDGVQISATIGGSGPPLLLLHGHPQTRALWHRVAPKLAEHHTLVAADLRGYGDSSKPPGSPDHGNYAKRVMAQDHVSLMKTLGFDPCLSGLLPMRYSDAKFRPWIPVVSRRRSQNFSGYSPMTRPAQDTLSSCGGRRGLRVPSAEILMSRTVLPSEERSYCGAALAIPISRLRLAPSCNRAIRRCLHGSGARTW